MRLDQRRQARGVAEPLRDHRAVEIRSEADAVLADLFEHVLDMIDDELDRRVAVLAAVGAQEAHREIHADHAVGFADRRQVAGR